MIMTKFCSFILCNVYYLSRSREWPTPVPAQSDDQRTPTVVVTGSMVSVGHLIAWFSTSIPALFRIPYISFNTSRHSYTVYVLRRKLKMCSSRGYYSSLSLRAIASSSNEVRTHWWSNTLSDISPSRDLAEHL